MLNDTWNGLKGIDAPLPPATLPIINITMGTKFHSDDPTSTHRIYMSFNGVEVVEGTEFWGRIMDTLKELILETNKNNRKLAVKRRKGAKAATTKSKKKTTKGAR